MSKPGFQLKASSFTFSSCVILTPNLDIIEKQLAALVSKTPNFFDATPVFIDLTTVELQGLPVDLIKLIALLRRYSLYPIALKSYQQEYRNTAKECFLAIIGQNESSITQEDKGTPSAHHTHKTTIASQTTKIIDQPVRSGTQVYAKNSDLVVIASVSHGAEVIADGNIHIYGTLNGRALAGAQGNEKARVFCKSLDAELLAIAGHYLVSEQIQDHYKLTHHYLEIYFEDDKLQFKTI